MVRNIITDLCHHLEIGIDGNLDIGNKRVIVGTPTITLTNNILTINCDTVGASIYYTLDGSTPTSSSTKYTNAVTLNNSCTIKAIAIKGNKSSIVVSQDYIAILSAWKMMGNSIVHTDEYLTQWKVEGNSVVDNNTILSCGDLGQDGYYHVKISNGVTIYDIPLTEPLRKVNDVADSIEFVNGVATVTRNIASTAMSKLDWTVSLYSNTGKYRYNIYSLIGIIKPAKNNNTPGDILCTIYSTTTANGAYVTNLEGIAVESVKGSIYLYDSNYDKKGDLNAFLEHIQGAEIVYALATPTTEVIQVSPFPVSATDTYTSVNDTPYSAFEYKKNVEIWSCGEYSAVDNKWHIRILSEGYGIVDIALDEPLRKVNNVADNIEFADGVATLTRKIASVKWNDCNITYQAEREYKRFLSSTITSLIYKPTDFFEREHTCLSSDFIQSNAPLISSVEINPTDLCMAVNSNGFIFIRDTSTTSVEDFYEKYGTHEFLYRLATPTTETIQVPQIQEADSYSCVISQGGKAVSWSSFIPNPS